MKGSLDKICIPSDTSAPFQSTLPPVGIQCYSKLNYFFSKSNILEHKKVGCVLAYMLSKPLMKHFMMNTVDFSLTSMTS
jgi:hypothetical protein